MVNRIIRMSMAFALLLVFVVGCGGAQPPMVVKEDTPAAQTESTPAEVTDTQADTTPAAAPAAGTPELTGATEAEVAPIEEEGEAVTAIPAPTKQPENIPIPTPSDENIAAVKQGVQAYFDQEGIAADKWNVALSAMTDGFALMTLLPVGVDATTVTLENMVLQETDGTWQVIAGPSSALDAKELADRGVPQQLIDMTSTVAE